MAILGLTDKAASFPQIGSLRKGAPKPETGNQPGAELKHFRFDCDDAEALALFKETYGEKPAAINVFVPFKSVDENFEAWAEEYTASSLRHRCDGQTCVQWITTEGKYSFEPKPCPGGCKPTGRLKVIIPELKRLAYVTVHTTSINDIIRVHSNLLALEQARGSLQGIPLVLRRTPEEISTPEIDKATKKPTGKRLRREKWLISIEAQPQWVQLQLSAQQQAALPSATLQLNPAPLALSAYSAEDFDEEDVIDGAYIAESNDIEEALHKLFKANGKTDWTKYFSQHIAPLTLDEKRKRLESWQAKALENQAKAATATTAQAEPVIETAIV